MSSRVLALLACLGATTIYGLNHTIAKVVMPDYIGAFGFILLRVSGAALLFWTVSIWLPKETINRSDYVRIACAAFLGMCINMLMFFKGLELSTPINSGVIVTLTPIIVLILSSFFLDERFTLIKLLGVVLGFSGTLFLILYGTSGKALNAPNIPLGNSLLFINASSFAAYLIVIKPLARKYHPITLMKWMFLLGILMNFPVAQKEFFAVSWGQLSFDVIWRMTFVVVGTTFLTYVLNLFALRTLPASTIGVFVYLQPIIAIIYAVTTGNDTLDLIKIMACFLVFAGVYLVSKKKKTPSTT